MATIANHEITEAIYESVNSLVYRAHQRDDDKTVILKVLKQDYPSPEELTRYRQEYEITRSLTLDNIVKAYGQEKHRNTLVMFLEDFGGESLRILTDKRPMELTEFLDCAIKMTHALGDVHTHRIIHKDINPANVVMNQETGELKLIDFGISTKLTRENRVISNPNALEGTLAYMSPEQTGRMNCALDYRTDFYSLGVTFYELLTGILPFETDDALELVHAHLVKEPRPPHEVRADVPKALSDLIMRLMAKRPEERYQSAWGIVADLREFAIHLREHDDIGPFALGTQDISDRFEIPHKLYGRDAELAQLLSAFDDTCQGTTTLMLVAGYSGIGKTSLVQELYKPITRQKGYFISGKYDQFQRNSPYSAIAAAFRDLVRQLLTEDRARLQQWKDELLRALGPNAQLINDVIPEMALIIGSQAPVPELGPAETRNRFNLTFLDFLRVFCRATHPLVLFLDDLQWVDAASLSLIDLIMTDDDTHYFFLMGAYRDNEVDESHPMMISRQNIIENGTNVVEIVLGPLNQDHISQLLGDTLRQPASVVEPLAQLTMKKTGGNPFFANQFLTSLYQRGMITFAASSDGSERTWQWSTEQIDAMEITDNVVDLVVGKLRVLAEETQEALRLAACVGNRFGLDTLAAIRETSLADTYRALLPALQDGFILSQSDLETVGEEAIDTDLVIRNFKFLHDRVQQAAYALIDDSRKKAVRLQIGRLLIDHLSQEEQDERIFELVDHLNEGRELLKTADELAELAHRNLLAGQRALASTAYAAAREYLRNGLTLLDESSWDVRYRDAFEMHRDLARAEYFNNNFDEAKALLRVALDKAATVSEKVALHSLQAIQDTTQNKYRDAIDEGKEALALLGYSLPSEGLEQAFAEEQALFEKNLANIGDVPSLLDQGTMENRDMREAIQIMNELIAATYISDQSLWAVIALRIANLSMQHGNIAESAIGYVSLGALLAAQKRYDLAHQYGQLSLRLTVKLDDARQICPTHSMHGAFIAHWKDPLEDATAIFDKGYKAGLQAGNLNFAGYITNFRHHHLYYLGKPLPGLVAKDFPPALKFLKKTENQTPYDILKTFELAAKALSATVPERDAFGSPEGKACLQGIIDNNSYFALCGAYILQSQLNYYYGRYREAFTAAQKAEGPLGYMPGAFGVAEHRFYRGLTLAVLASETASDGADGADGDEQASYLSQLDQDCQQMAAWAHHCPANFVHKHRLMTAEQARVQGKTSEAMDLYDEAIEAAAESGFIQDEALANELAGRFWLARGKAKIASVYLRDALQGFRNWGAVRKVEDLEARYPQFLAGTRQSAASPLATTTTSTSGSGRELDLATVIQASRAISEARELNTLLAQVMEIALENAGAERGFLILHREQNLIIKAKGIMGRDEVIEPLSMELTDSDELAHGIVQYVDRTREAVVLDDVVAEGQFTADPYVQIHECKSILCLPIVNQGTLIAIAFMENNKIRGAFTADRLEILKLLMTPAAVSIENALFKAREHQGAFEYQVGGSLAADAESYVTRQADRELRTSLQAGAFCYILNARQMGKSSLRVHVMRRLTAENVTCVGVDITMIGSNQITPPQWYAGMARTLVQGLGLSSQINVRTWWRERKEFSPIQCLSELFDQEILERIPGNIVVLIDEIDSVLGLNFSLDDFFAMIRGFFNRRAEDARYQRLTFALFGVASPSDLIRDRQRTPFNIGKGIALSGFRLSETKPLSLGLRAKSTHPEAVLEAVLSWTEGQPFLTQKVCQLLQSAETSPRPGQESTWVGNVVARNIIDNWEAQDEPEHLKTIRDRILESDNARGLLALYRDILQQGILPAGDSPYQNELLLSGLVTSAWGKVQVSNRIYQAVFSPEWVANALASQQD